MRTSTDYAGERHFAGENWRRAVVRELFDQGEDVHAIDVLSVTPDVWHTLGPFTINVPACSLPPLLVANFADVRVSAGLFGDLPRGRDESRYGTTPSPLDRS